MITPAEQQFANEFGSKLKMWRLGQKVSQEALAVAIEVHRNTIHHWEEGEAMVSLFDVLRIVGVLRCDLGVLLPSTSFVWGREVPKRPPVRYATLKQVVEERDKPLTRAERG